MNTAESQSFADLYDAHLQYAARRREGTFEYEQVKLEVEFFKLPGLCSVLHPNAVDSVLEIGCATGELIARFPINSGGFRIGVDISSENIASAADRYPGVTFYAGDFRNMALPTVDTVVLSDILEHVPDDAKFLADASRLCRQVLVNLPLECNWLNRGRAYGIHDPSGHLRAYTVEQGLSLFDRAGLDIIDWRRVWFHETEAEQKRRALRQKLVGAAYSGSWLGREARKAVYASARWSWLGRQMFSSNLFARAVARQRQSYR